MLSAKETDNTWLQLQVCPVVFKERKRCPDESDESKCQLAHPDGVVLDKSVLHSGYVVCCHDYVFSHNGKRRGCTRANCKYFHPPSHLRHLVINAGKNNLRLRNEIQTSLRRQVHDQQQQQLQQQHLQLQQQQQQVMLQAYPTAQGYVCQALPSSLLSPSMLSLAPYCLPQQSVSIAKPASIGGQEPDPPGTEGGVAVGVAVGANYGQMPPTPPTSPLTPSLSTVRKRNVDDVGQAEGSSGLLKRAAIAQQNVAASSASASVPVSVPLSALGYSYGLNGLAAYSPWVAASQSAAAATANAWAQLTAPYSFQLANAAAVGKFGEQYPTLF